MSEKCRGIYMMLVVVMGRSRDLLTDGYVLLQEHTHIATIAILSQPLQLSVPSYMYLPCYPLNNNLRRKTSWSWFPRPPAPIICTGYPRYSTYSICFARDTLLITPLQHVGTSFVRSCQVVRFLAPHWFSCSPSGPAQSPVPCTD